MQTSPFLVKFLRYWYFCCHSQLDNVSHFPLGFTVLICHLFLISPKLLFHQSLLLLEWWPALTWLMTYSQHSTCKTVQTWSNCTHHRHGHLHKPSLAWARGPDTNVESKTVFWWCITYHGRAWAASPYLLPLLILSKKEKSKKVTEKSVDFVLTDVLFFWLPNWLTKSGFSQQKVREIVNLLSVGSQGSFSWPSLDCCLTIIWLWLDYGSQAEVTWLLSSGKVKKKSKEKSRIMSTMSQGKSKKCPEKVRKESDKSRKVREKSQKRVRQKSGKVIKKKS